MLLGGPGSVPQHSFRSIVMNDCGVVIVVVVLVLVAEANDHTMMMVVMMMMPATHPYIDLGDFRPLHLGKSSVIGLEGG